MRFPFAFLLSVFLLAGSAAADEKDDRIRKLEAEVGSLREALSEMHANLQKVRDERDGAHRRIEDLHEEIRARERTNEERTSELRLELERARDGLVESRAEMQHLREEADAVRGHLESQIQAVRAELTREEIDRRETEERLSEARRDLARYRERVRELARAPAPAGQDAAAALRQWLAATKVDCSFRETAIEDAVGFLGGIAGRTFVVLPDDLDRTITARAEGIPVLEFLESELPKHGLAHRMFEGVVLVGSAEALKKVPAAGTLLAIPAKKEGEAPWRETIRKALRSPISFSFDGAELLEAMSFVRNVKGMNLVPIGEDDLVRYVTLSLHEAPTATALRLLALLGDARAEIRWGAVVMGTSDALEALGPIAGETSDTSEASRKTLEALHRTTVSTGFEETAITDIISFFQSVAGVKMRVEIPDEADAEYPVSLRVADVSLANALRLALRPRDLTFEVREGVVVVRPVK